MLSIIIPVYNSEAFLEPCLAGIAKSSYHDYELIVVDDGSSDRSVEIAREYADQVIQHPCNRGRSHARDTGITKAHGDILVFIDSDVEIYLDSLQKIKEYFNTHPEFDALTGRLSLEHPHPNFFSQYKNIYMHYIFGKLPQQVNFLYGSIHAIRADCSPQYRSLVAMADDTEMGQKLVNAGKKIGYLNCLQAVHYKKYDFVSFFYNDFRIPFDWAIIFSKYAGWKQIGKNKSGYAHSPKEQLVSIMILGLMSFIILLVLPFYGKGASVLLVLLLIWCVLNQSFFRFLTKVRGLKFGMKGVVVTFIDHFTMGLGIFCGFSYYAFSYILKCQRFFSSVNGVLERE